MTPARLEILTSALSAEPGAGGARGAVSAYAALADLLATLGVTVPPVGRVLALVGGAF